MEQEETISSVKLDESPAQMPVSANGETLLDMLRKMLDDPKFQEQMAKQVIVRRPPGSSKRSNYAYYREQFGLQAKLVLDQMMVEKCDKIWAYSDFPSLSRQSLYLRVHQSLHYLMEELDKDGKYKEFKKQIYIETIPGRGIAFRFIRDTLNGVVARTYTQDAPAEKTIMEKISEFLNDEKQRIFKLNCVLSDADVEQIQTSLAPLDNVLAAVTRTEIKIVKQK